MTDPVKFKPLGALAVAALVPVVIVALFFAGLTLHRVLVIELKLVREPALFSAMLLTAITGIAYGHLRQARKDAEAEAI